MVKKAIIGILLSALVITMIPAPVFAYSYEVEQGTIIYGVNFRPAPATSNTPIRMLKQGEEVEIIERINSSWLKVKDQHDQIGYMSSSKQYIEINSILIQPEPNATIVKSVNFRTGPSTSNSSMRFLRAGESIWILEQVSAYWYQIADANNVIGYISTKEQYVQLLNPQASELVEPEIVEPEIVEPEIQPNAVIVRSVNFRTGPSTSASQIRFLQTGEEIYILEQANSYWYKAVDQSDVIGYVSAQEKYVELIGEIPSPDAEEPEVHEPEKPQTNGVIVRAVNFRTGPSTSNAAIRFLKSGEEVNILEQVNSYWYKIQDQHGIIGYISTSPTYIDSSYEPPLVDYDYSQAVEKVINAGMAYWGTPYEFGSNRNSTLTFDCSAFVRRAILDGVGLVIPSNSRNQADYVRKVGKTSTDWKQLKRGDLLFFMDYLGASKSKYSGINVQNQRISHVGIYLGNGQMLHTYSVDSGGVRIDSIEDRHWEYRFVIGGSAF